MCVFHTIRNIKGEGIGLFSANLSYFCRNSLQNMSNSTKERYRQLCNEKPIPLFMQAWWMDAACQGKEWDVLLCEKDKEIIGVLPYLLVKKWGFCLILQPQLTQYNGVWIDYPEQCELQQRYALEKEVMSDLILQLEKLKINYFEQNFHFSATNWQPFYWKGFKQTTRYTYQLDNIVNSENIYSSFHLFKQRHINKAQKKLQVDFNLSIEEFYSFHSQSILAKGGRVFYSKSFFEKLAKSAVSRQQGAVIAVRDKENNIHAAMFVVWDKSSAYYLVSAINPTFKSSGASIYMVWEAIRFLSAKTKKFDFEGSMIEGVAKANQEFGATQIPYFTISKSSSILLPVLMKIKNKVWK
jgi:hypothetical protein